MATKKNGGRVNTGAARRNTDQFRITLSPLGLDGAETPQYSPDECVEVDLARRQSNQGARKGPHGSEYSRNERRGG